MKELTVSLDSKKFVFSSAPNIIKISEPLRKQTNIHFMMYTQYLDNGTAIDLTTKQDWVKYYYSTYFIKKEMDFISNRVKPGINYWRRNKNDTVSEIREDARDNFDIDARIDFIYRDEFNKCFHAYSFCSDKKHADQVYAFYGQHISKLFKFIQYFNVEAKELILEASKPENRIMIPEYSPILLEKATAGRNYADELKQENVSFEPSDREFEVMLLYAHGVTKIQIAKMLNRSVSTIETHIDNIKNKSNLKDRFSMLMYLKNRNWDGSIVFFSPYIPKCAA